MENEFLQLREFLSVFWSYNKRKISINNSLDDLGMYGDDKRDFLKSFVRTFNIESANLNYNKFCEPEVFNPFSALIKKNKKDEIILKVSLSHLVNVMKEKKWFDP
jgi:hypothetical protein